MADTNSLREVPLFARLSKRDLSRLARATHEHSYKAGRVLTREGTTGSGFFVILEGTAKVEVPHKRTKRLGPGAYFGEMALIDKAARSATVVATTACRCLVFTSWAFRPFLRSQPDAAWAMLEMMVHRVREAEAR